MSIGGLLRTSVSGMNAQSTRLSSVSENIANSGTIGYKQKNTEFSSLLVSSNGEYNPGTVVANVHNQVSEQGSVTGTGNNVDSKAVDLAISGNGFLVVTDGSGGYFLTRSGSFSKQADGTLVNTAGYTLVGTPAGASGTDVSLNSFTGLEPITFSSTALNANPTTEGILTVPLNQNFVVGSRATIKETAPFSATGGQAVQGNILQFDVTVDGEAFTVKVPSTTSAGVSGITSTQIMNAINATKNAAGNGLAGVASLDSNNNLILTSNGKKTGEASTISLTNITQTNSTGAALTGADLATIGTGLNATVADVKGADSVNPGDNSNAVPASNSTISKSVTVYTNSGEAVKLDLYYTKTDDNSWSVAVFDNRTANAAGTNKPFPYGKAALTTAQLTFDPTTFQLTNINGVTGGTATVNADTKSLNLDLSSIGGVSSMAIDLSATTQYTGTNQALTATFNGNPAEVVDKISISESGTVTAIFASGTRRDLYKIPLAKVESPDSLTPVSGNAYTVGVESGTVLLGYGGSDGFGSISHGSLEESTVDLATELTTMIESQRSYTANSKVFQTGSEILDVLVNLKR